MRKIAPLFIILGFVAMIAIASIPARVTVQVDRGSIASSPAWPGLVRTAPIAITSDADWSTYASSGDGSAGSPWILENMLIECNDTGSGVIVTSTTDFAVIRNTFVNESGTGPTDVGFLIQAVANLVIENVTAEFNNVNLAIVASQNVNVSGTFSNPIAGTFVNVLIDDCDDTVFDMRLNNGSMSAFRIFTAGDSERIGIENSTFYNSTIDIQNVVNVTIDNILSYNVSTGISLSTSENVTISGSSIVNVTNDGIHSMNSVDLVIVDNTISFVNDTCIYINDVCDGASVSNNTVMNATHGIYISQNDNVAVFNNVVYNCTTGIDTDICINTTIYDNVIYNCNLTAIATYESPNATIANNTCYNNTRMAIYGHGMSHNLTIRNNTCYSNGWSGITLSEPDNCTIANNTCYNNGYYAIEMRDGTNDAIIVNNSLYSNLLDEVSFTNPGESERSVYINNAWGRYFNEFPYAITISATSTTLEYEYPATSVNDTAPRYQSNLYPRSQTVNIRVYSNVDGQGIIFDNLKIYVDSVQIATASPVIEHVLFRLTIEDFKGRLLWDQMYNLNDTGTNLNIGVDIAVQVFISFYSNFDFFGLPFDLVKLYIDNVRITRPDPIMELRTITITIRDFASRVLYNQSVNLSVTGIFIEIGLDIAYVAVHNQFDHDVLFHYAIAGVEVTIPMAAGQIIDDLRVAIGTYTWYVTDLDGDILEDEDGEDIFEIGEVIAGPDAISFGWVDLTPPDPGDTIVSSSVLDYVVFFMAIGAGLGGMLLVAWWARGGRFGIVRVNADRGKGSHLTGGKASKKKGGIKWNVIDS